MGFLIVPNLVPWLIFRAWFVTDQFCHVTFHFNNDREGIKEREDNVMGGGGGEYSREVIFFKISIKGGQLFEGGD